MGVLARLALLALLYYIFEQFALFTATSTGQGVALGGWSGETKKWTLHVSTLWMLADDLRV
uniref:Uncharacterized protein n=1 Tax=Thermosporothrix sp. COM3 TaxID=2490863 RepID=A0A455SXS5_9CHLR|nr:hypothetical protein KTC_56560 [Thermosporothrix sp. COM3]